MCMCVWGCAIMEMDGDGQREEMEEKNCTNCIMYAEKPDAYEGQLIERKYSAMLISKPKDSSDQEEISIYSLFFKL